MSIDSLPVSVTCVTDRQQRKTSNMARVNLHKFPLIHSSGLGYGVLKCREQQGGVKIRF